MKCKKYAAIHTGPCNPFNMFVENTVLQLITETHIECLAIISKVKHQENTDISAEWSC